MSFRRYHGSHLFATKHISTLHRYPSRHCPLPTIPMPISLQGAEGKEEVVEEHRPGQQKGCRAEHFKRRRLRKPLYATEGACAVAGSLHLASASSGAAAVLRSLLQLAEGASVPGRGPPASSSAGPAPLDVHLPMLLAWPCSLLALLLPTPPSSRDEQFFIQGLPFSPPSDARSRAVLWLRRRLLLWLCTPLPSCLSPPSAACASP